MFAPAPPSAPAAALLLLVAAAAAAAATAPAASLGGGETLRPEEGSWQAAGCALSGSNKDVLDCSAGHTGGALTAVPSGIPATVVHLWLSGNGITTLRAGDFSHARSLRYLFLEDNEIGTIERGAFDGLSDLLFLLLDNNDLSEIKDGVLSPLRSLHTLDLKHNNIRALGPATLAGLASLGSLNLYGNEVYKVECGALNHLRWLEHLNMGQNPAACSLGAASGVVACRCPAPFATGAQGYCSQKDVCAFSNPAMYGAELTRDQHPRGWKLLNPRQSSSPADPADPAHRAPGGAADPAVLAGLRQSPTDTDKLIQSMLATGAPGAGPGAQANSGGGFEQSAAAGEDGRDGKDADTDMMFAMVGVMAVGTALLVAVALYRHKITAFFQGGEAQLKAPHQVSRLNLYAHTSDNYRHHVAPPSITLDFSYGETACDASEVSESDKRSAAETEEMFNGMMLDEGDYTHVSAQLTCVHPVGGRAAAGVPDIRVTTDAGAEGAEGAGGARPMSSFNSATTLASMGHAAPDYESHVAPTRKSVKLAMSDDAAIQM